MTNQEWFKPIWSSSPTPDISKSPVSYQQLGNQSRFQNWNCLKAEIENRTWLPLKFLDAYGLSAPNPNRRFVVFLTMRLNNQCSSNMHGYLLHNDSIKSLSTNPEATPLALVRFTPKASNSQPSESFFLGSPNNWFTKTFGHSVIELVPQRDTDWNPGNKEYPLRSDLRAFHNERDLN